MKISVVMPTFNAARFLNDALDSLAQQTDENFELIVFDGGSTDATLDILAEHKLPHRLLRDRDDGAYDGLNRAFNASDGEILCWLNSDDVYLHPEVLAIVRRTFALHSNRPMIYGHSCVLDCNGAVSKTLLTWQVDYKSSLDGFNLFTGSMFFRRSLWSGFGGFSGRSKSAFEYELVDYAFRSGSPLFVDEMLAGLRIHEQTISYAARDTMIHDIEEARGRTTRHPVLRRMAQARRMATSGMLGRAVRNWHKDHNAGKHWREISAAHLWTLT